MAFTEEGLALLTKGARTLIPFFRAAAEANPNAGSDELIGIVGEQAKLARRSDMLSIIRTIKGNQQLRPGYLSVRNDRLPTVNTIGRSLTKTSQDFTALTRITGIHPTTGERVTRNVTVTTNKLLTKATIIDIANSFRGAEGKSAPLENAKVEVLSFNASADFEF